MSTKYIFFSGKGGLEEKPPRRAPRRCDWQRRERKHLLLQLIRVQSGRCLRASHWTSVTPIQGKSNLWAMEIDPDKATQEYIDRAMAPIRAVFPSKIVQVMKNQMSGPCTAEVHLLIVLQIFWKCLPVMRLLLTQ